MHEICLKVHDPESTDPYDRLYQVSLELEALTEREDMPLSPDTLRGLARRLDQIADGAV